MTNQPPIYLINLKRSPDRLAKTSQQFEENGLEYTRVEAVDGKLLTEQEKAKNYCATLNQKHYHKPLTDTQIGCYMSHRLAWQAIAEGDYDFGIVVEDDITFDSSLIDAIATLKRVPVQWQIIKLAAYQNRERKIKYATRIDDSFDLVVHRKPMSGGAATAITKKAAKQLLKHSEKFGRPCDTDIQHFWEKQISVMSLMPYPVRQTVDFTSTINAKKSQQKSHFIRRKSQQLYAGLANRKAVAKQVLSLKAQLSVNSPRVVLTPHFKLD